MKKLMAQSLAMLAFNTSLFAQIEPPPCTYEGPEDDTYWTGTSSYENLPFKTTLGILAYYSDIIGMGLVSDLQKEGPYHTSRHYCTVSVDQAFVGCTNGQAIVMYETPFMEFMGGRSNAKKLITCRRTTAGLSLLCLQMFIMEDLG